MRRKERLRRALQLGEGNFVRGNDRDNHRDVERIDCDFLNLMMMSGGVKVGVIRGKIPGENEPKRALNTILN
jgi:hypothetical protein